MNPGPLLLVPRTGKGRGGGHLVRCTALVRELRSLGREAWLYLPGFTGDTRAFWGDSADGEGFDPGRIMTGEGELRGRPWDWIILDYFRTPRKLFEELAALAPLIAIDEGGPCRGRCDFTLDLLPGLSDSPGKGANYFLPGLLPLPKNRRPSFYPASPDRPPRVLVSFGAEDPRKLTVPLALALGGQTPEGQTPEISVLFGPLYDRGNPSRTAEDRRVLEGAGIRVLGEVPLLREHLAEYDLVITHFGLTAFEALHARTAVLLLAPGGCHEKLAVRAGFPSAGIGRRGIGRLRRMLGVKAPSKTGKADPLSPPGLAELRRRCEGLVRSYGLDQAPSQTLGTLLRGFSPLSPRRCPVCGAEITDRRVLARFPDRSYRRCGRCGMVYLLRAIPPPIEYEGDYFFDFYKKQYGKTYLEDFPHLKELGMERLARIRGLLPAASSPDQPRLLDIGCAYGPFLAAAVEAGFSPTGIDPGEDAVRYVAEILGLPAFRAFFPDLPPGRFPAEGGFDAVTLWYVIEHFPDPQRALEEIRRLLKPGGVLAFSTPSFRGISGRKSPVDFLEKSPPDHLTLWDPGKTGALLRQAGFTLKRIVPTGHHPERFPLIGGFTLMYRPFYRCIFGLSRLLALGDTFEVYAVKNGGEERYE